MEIKSCPFCGAKANIFEHESRYSHGDSQWHIECPACHAASKLCDSESVAIELWGLRSNQRTQQDDIHKAAYIALTEHFVVDWCDWEESTDPQDWIKAIHALIQWNLAIAHDPKVGGTPQRTAQDDDNALIVRSLYRGVLGWSKGFYETYKWWVVVDSHGREQSINFTDEGQPLLTDEIRTALKKALGVQEGEG